MLDYAAHRRQRRKLSPSALALILGGHAVALALVVTTRMELVTPPKLPPLIVEPIPLPPDPPKIEPKVEPKPSPSVSSIEAPPTKVEVPLAEGPVVVPIPAPPNPGPVVGTSPLPQPLPIPQPEPLPPPAPPAKVVKVAAVLATPPDRLRPPYPDSKRRMEEEALLRLRLGIDERGRVTSVDPVGAADPAFLASARAHLTRHWRYRPATEDGRAVATSIVVTLRFELEE